ncbi:MAG TPA: hypothetical protein DIU15_20370, partial [Deltaproteobacteria bacterium]|nr:hypothetical protein [Deltaproteobacteria bacterium]
MATCGGGYSAWPSGDPNTIWKLSTSFPSADLTSAQVAVAMDAAFDEWAEPGCSEFNAERGPDAALDPLAQDGAFSVGFYETDWPASLGDALAVTTWYTNGQCEVTEADIVFRGTDVLWVDDGWLNYLEVDVQAVATHEVGHWVGFGHDSTSGSPMNPTYSGTRSERTLTCNNTEGVCTLYPASGVSCSQDRYCPCGVGCNDGLCEGAPTNSDEEELFEPGDCDDGPSASIDEEEPNDELYDSQYLSRVEGDLEISGSLSSCGNGLDWTGDMDRIVLDMDCADEVTFVLDWSDSDADLDFWVDGLGLSGQWEQVADSVEWGSPPAWDSGIADRDLNITIACWSGVPSDWTLNVYFGPP